jgi:hypothetical protein
MINEALNAWQARSETRAAPSAINDKDLVGLNLRHYLDRMGCNDYLWKATPQKAD